jgi:hypothetical protein
VNGKKKQRFMAATVAALRNGSANLLRATISSAS